MLIKFLKTVLLYFSLLFSVVWFFLSFYIIFVKHHYDWWCWFFLFMSGGGIFAVIDELKSIETPEEKPKTETNIDKPKESDDVVVVTEIQGERKIIKNGKVIYSEKLKADELKVFEKDKN